MENKNNDRNSLSYKIGQFLAVTLFGCAAAILIALTAKLILWII